MRSVSAWPTECLDEVVPERSESRFLIYLRRRVVAAPARPVRSKASGWNDVLSPSAVLSEALKTEGRPLLLLVDEVPHLIEVILIVMGRQVGGCVEC